MLNQDLKSALGEQIEADMQKAKNIQLQIQMAQMQPNQLVQREAEKSKKALEKTDVSTQSGSANNKRNDKEHQIDVFVWSAIIHPALRLSAHISQVGPNKLLNPNSPGLINMDYQYHSSW